MNIRVAIHKKTTNRYFVLTTTAELKREDGDWVRAYIYSDNVNVYCREERDFLEKFILLDD